MSDIFQEVDEEVRRDKALEFWKKHQNLIIAGAALIVLATGGYRFYENRKLAAQQAAGAAFQQALALDRDGKGADAQAALAAARRQRAARLPDAGSPRRRRRAEQDRSEGRARRLRRARRRSVNRPAVPGRGQAAWRR